MSAGRQTWRVGDTLLFEKCPFEDQTDLTGQSLRDQKVYYIYIGPLNPSDPDVDNPVKNHLLFSVVYPRKLPKEVEGGRAVKFIRSRYPMFRETNFLYFAQPVKLIQKDILEQYGGSFMVTGQMPAPDLKNFFLGYFAHQTMPPAWLRNVKRAFARAGIRKLPPVNIP